MLNEAVDAGAAIEGIYKKPVPNVLITGITKKEAE